MKTGVIQTRNRKPLSKSGATNKLAGDDGSSSAWSMLEPLPSAVSRAPRPFKLVQQHPHPHQFKSFPSSFDVHRPPLPSALSSYCVFDATAHGVEAPPPLYPAAGVDSAGGGVYPAVTYVHAPPQVPAPAGDYACVSAAAFAGPASFSAGAGGYCL